MDAPIIIEFLGSAGMENIDGYDCWPTTVMRPDVEEVGLPRPFQCDEPYALVPLVPCDDEDCWDGMLGPECNEPCPACMGGWKPKGGYVYDGPDGRWLHIRLGGGLMDTDRPMR